MCVRVDSAKMLLIRMKTGMKDATSLFMRFSLSRSLRSVAYEFLFHIYIYFFHFITTTAFKAIFVISIYNYIYGLLFHGLHGNPKALSDINVVVGE